jgi:hypothetical protein
MVDIRAVLNNGECVGSLNHMELIDLADPRERKELGNDLQELIAHGIAMETEPTAPPEDEDGER